MRIFQVLLCALVQICAVLAQTPPRPPVQAPDAGRRQYDSHCSVCHGGDGAGGELAPSILFRLPNRNDQELADLVRTGISSRGMPAFSLTDPEMSDLIAFLRTLRPHRGFAAPVRKKVETTDGKTLEGLVLGESSLDLALRTDDQRIHLLRTAGGRYRPVTSQTDWPTYNGQPGGNRYTTLTQIDKSNVAKLAPKWVFTMSNVSRLETTPLVVEGIMYVTSGNECYALDAGNGRELWHFQRPRTRGLVGNAAGGFNRGVGVAGDRVFMVTDNAHIIALHRFTGALLWETEMADWHQNYNATSAPLVAGGLVISGTAGGEQGARGFLAAYDQAGGKEVWRFWTVPARGEPGSETWIGKGIEHPSADTWFTGAYDSQLGLLYWPTGNPGPDYNDDERGGDNLYSCSILALDAKTGKLKWYYQATPHDVFDWDATEPLVLVDADWQGQARKLLIQANRNGFFYVFDRTSGKLLLAKPFVTKMTWATGVAPDGRPIRNPSQAMPSAEGAKVCPSQDGATNWFSTSYNPAAGLFYVQTLEKCTVFTKRPVEWEAGRGYLGGSARNVPDETPHKILRAIKIQTGDIAWELPQVGRGDSWGGTLASAAGLVFFGDDSGMFMAADALTGKPLWQFQTNQLWKASPMTYVFDGKQYFAAAAGQNIFAFGLLD
ncbi:MAG TPA: PQQ-binding-like beta-propeller repeat protein [Bryobacteraceae bacterium]|nr:PQQ-binding-like beta-propeller repeat protein [Bryobacteraceae bacterium]